ncbi:hypothetical protein BCR35DRAFT_331134 [Leucosporidium creatinivorum]|uniref:Uncharacterized protein n=1 Tax=Leucosporidium creatinivorum TaxID=106004 RepID=A0A1Y2FHP5_9BASI|nr:hypothetical protein BCR35DRAFT_331134 [Leucosporidium creatinivorum]
MASHSPDQGKVATSGAAKSSTSSESVASPAEPSLPSPPALPSLPPPTSNTTEPLTTKPTPSLASNTTPEPTPPSDEAILSALTSPPDVDDSPLSSSPPSQPLHDFRPSPALQNPILEALMQKALQDEAAADAKGVIRSGPGGSGGESVDEVKSSLEEEILLFSEVSARRAEAAVGRQRSWVEEELKPNAEEGESKEQTSEKAGKEP